MNYLAENTFLTKENYEERLEEIESWYERNYSYIHELDTTLFKKDILEYDLEYADLLYLFAGAIGAQKQDLIEAIELLESIKYNSLIILS